jgi:hypothetical protein
MHVCIQVPVCEQTYSHSAPTPLPPLPLILSEPETLRDVGKIGLNHTHKTQNTCNTETHTTAHTYTHKAQAHLVRSV